MGNVDSALLKQLPRQQLRFRLRPTPASDIEAGLVMAARYGRQAASDRTSERFCDVRLDDLTQNIDAKTPQVLRVDADFLKRLDVSGIDRCLTTMDARPGHLRFADGSRRQKIPELEHLIAAGQSDSSLHELRPFGAVDALRDGATLVANNLVQRLGGELRLFADDIARITGSPAGVNCYLSQRDALGFGRHWDDHDVIVLQVHGRKHWELFEPISLSSRIGYTPTREFGPQVFSTVLEEGLALFIPRGWGHQVQGFVGETSLHLTVGLRYQTMMDVFDEVRAQTESEYLLRPIEDAAEGETLNFGVDRDLLEHAVGAFRSRLTSLGGPGPLQIAEAATTDYAHVAFEAPFPGGLVFADSPDIPSGAVGFAAGEVGLYANHSEVPVLEALLRGDVVSIGAGSPHEKGRELVLAMAHAGVARIQEER